MVHGHSQARMENIRSVCSNLLISSPLQIVVRRCGVGRSQGQHHGAQESHHLSISLGVGGEGTVGLYNGEVGSRPEEG
jgi:hypothetical protein